MSTEPTTIAAIQKDVLDSTESLVWMLSMAERPGLNLFLVRLEYDHYPPDTPANEKFQLATITWQDMLWFLASIPAEDRPIADKVAAECHLHLVGDGIEPFIPMLLTSDGPVRFPISGVNVFPLETSDGVFMDKKEERQMIDARFAQFEDYKKSLEGINAPKEVQHIDYAVLLRVAGSNDPMQSRCPVCWHGSITVRRSPIYSLNRNRSSQCDLCGQHFEYDSFGELL